MADISMSFKFFLNCFSPLLQLFKKAHPAEIALVKIDTPIVTVYMFFNNLPLFFTTPITGISNLNISELPCNNKLNKAKLSSKTIPVHIVAKIILSVLHFILLLSGINTGINTTQL